MNILSWNVRGLGKPKRRRLVKEIIFTHHIDIVSIQETKKSEFKERTLRNLSNILTKWVILPADGNSGGILVGINENKIELIQSWIFNYSITILFKQRNTGFI
jgi:exonuclease III